MKTSRLPLAMLLAVSLGSPLVFAQQQPSPGDDHGYGPGGGPGGPAMHHPQPGHGGPAGHPRPAPQGAGPRGEPPGGFIEGHRDWHRGDRIPREYWDRQYVVDDWRAYKLTPPPRGYHWVGIGGDYLLVQIASGVVLRVGP